jgi:SAM-dependent methyltransferase
MEDWYRTALANPAAVASMYDRDYGPYRDYLLGLTGDVLDLGGGAGVTRHFLREHVRYVVLDPSPAWLDRSWESLEDRFPCLKEPLSFVRGVGENLPFADGSFDAILSFWSLNHASDPEKVFREVWRTLRPEGKFLAVLEDMPDPLVPEEDRELGSDHVQISEDDLRRWIGDRFVVARRHWVKGTAPSRYLTFELVRAQTEAQVRAA